MPKHAEQRENKPPAQQTVGLRKALDKKRKKAKVNDKVKFVKGVQNKGVENKGVKKEKNRRIRKVQSEPVDGGAVDEKKDKKKYTEKIITLLWNTLKGLKDFLIKKYHKLAKNKGAKSMDEEDNEKRTLENKSQKFVGKLEAIKSVGLKELKLLVPFLLQFQLQEDLSRYWHLLEASEVGSTNKARCQQVRLQRLADEDGTKTHQKGRRHRRIRTPVSRSSRHKYKKKPSKDINENCLVIYEIIEKNKPRLYSDTVDQICKIINKHKEKAEKKELSRQKGRDKRALDKSPIVRKGKI